MRNVVKNKVEAAHFNECNTMALNYLSRNEEATSVCNLTFLLGLGPKFCPKKDKIAFKYSQDIFERLRRDARIRWYVLNNWSADETEEVLKLCRKNINWEPKNANGHLEGAINRFEQVAKVEFGTLRKKSSSYFKKTQKISLKHIRNQKYLQILLAEKIPIDPHFSDRITHEIISTKEAQENFSEVTNA